MGKVLATRCLSQATRYSPLGCVDGWTRDFNISDLRYIQHHNFILSHMLVTYFITGLKWDNSKIKYCWFYPDCLASSTHNHTIIVTLAYLSMLAPLETSVLTTEAWPWRAAMCRAVLPSLSSTSTRAPGEGGRKERRRKVGKSRHHKQQMSRVITVKMNSYHG